MYHKMAFLTVPKFYQVGHVREVIRSYTFPTFQTRCLLNRQILLLLREKFKSVASNKAVIVEP